MTDPLMAALRSGRTTHAYLFSGPRGCGKTTSARILARCLNCAQGPTDTPCGECDSCRELARGGGGSLDVVEMDAASHGGVDDARDLRDRAGFAPVRDRYKVFIIDEAHMVTPQGFNALLKIVEEPPAHVKFIFATTEPDKVIGTIRSRTHHYPFRLVPPETLEKYLAELCEQEGVKVERGVLPLVLRAGGGSVRDTLSVLDQLIGGSPDENLTYARAVALLGFTDATLLDDVVEAIGAQDGAALFTVVDRVIDSGHDPRRFAEDLLQRLRDVVVLAVAPEAASQVLPGLPEDQVQRISDQAKHLGIAQASRAADLTNDTLNTMGGATSPRIHLELLFARLLLPGAKRGWQGVSDRLDRVEHQLSSGIFTHDGAPPAPGPAADEPRESTPAPVAEPRTESSAPAGQPAPTPADKPAAQPAPKRESTASEPAARAGRAEEKKLAAEPQERTPAVTGQANPTHTQPTPEPPAQGAPEPSESQPSQPAGSGADSHMVRQRWKEVLATLDKMRRSTASLVRANAQVGPISGGKLALILENPGLVQTFHRGEHLALTSRALHETLGIEAQVVPVLRGQVIDDSPAPQRSGQGREPRASRRPRASHEGGAGDSDPSDPAGAHASTHTPTYAPVDYEPPQLDEEPPPPDDDFAANVPPAEPVFDPDPEPDSASDPDTDLTPAPTSNAELRQSEEPRKPEASNDTADAVPTSPLVANALAGWNLSTPASAASAPSPAHLPKADAEQDESGQGPAPRAGEGSQERSKWQEMRARIERERQGESHGRGADSGPTSRPTGGPTSGSDHAPGGASSSDEKNTGGYADRPYAGEFEGAELASPDDPVAEDSGMVGVPLVLKMFNASVIDEGSDEPGA